MSKASSEFRYNGVLILECVDKADPGSEGNFLSHMFNIMDVTSQYVGIRTKQQLIAMLKANPFNVVHITTHGCVGRRSFRGFWTPNDDKVRINDFPEGCLEGKMVVSTACLSGAESFGEAFMKRVSPTYYVAPNGSPKFNNAIYFAHWFYHNVMVLDLSPPQAMLKYSDGYKNPHDFMLFPTVARLKKDAA